MIGTLYVVATPIGNLKDITLRAIEMLRTVDLIAAEDTRHSKRLLQEYDITKEMISLHEHNEHEQIHRIIQQLQSGSQIALVSDAGTPLISDPGFPLIRAARAAGIKVVPIPGPCAAITALSAAGLPADHFIFEGFLPAKTQARCNRLSHLQYEHRTIIFYESVHRIAECLQDLLTVFGKTRRLVLARELTKTYETFLDGTIEYVLQQIEQDSNQQRGEFVLILQGYQIQENDGINPEAIRILRLLMEELPMKQAVQLTAKLTECRKNILYDYAVDKMKSDHK
ncbi:MAG: 16S rRNA (cytidine(1402)-2'-O)-methyltransferase [Gammaproteobacteria bacterium]